MNGRYKGWRTDTFCRIGPYDPLKRCFWAPLPPDKQVELALAYGFDKAIDTWQPAPARIIDVIFQQILEAINERRLAIKTYAPHSGIPETDWMLMWRNITWQDLFRHHGANDAGYLSLQHLIGGLRGMIWNEYWKPYDVEFYQLNPWLLPLGRFFCYPTDKSISGTNWRPFDSLESILDYAVVGGDDDDGNRAWTLRPKRYGRSAEYNRAIIQYPLKPLPFYCEYVNELRLVLNKLEYLYPALGFSLDRYYDKSTITSSCGRHWTLADHQAQLSTTWDALSPALTSQTKNAWPEAHYSAYAYPPSPLGCPTGQSHIETGAETERWRDPRQLDYELVLDGSIAYGVAAPSGWVYPVDWYTETGASLSAKLTLMNPGWSATWSLRAINARKHIDFDYSADE